jgi:dienelactone hydrolase
MIKFLVLVLLSFPVLSEAKPVKKDFFYARGDQKFQGYLVYDDAKKNTPGVLMIPDWMGVVQKAKDRADKIAQLGFTVLVSDAYGKDIRPTDANEAGKLAGALKNNRRELRNRIQAAYEELKKIPQTDAKKIVAIGYCFGGTAALEAARAGLDIKGIVTFHGGLDSPNPDDGKNIKGKVLALHGADDPYVSAADLTAFEDEMRKNNVDWRLVKYGGAVHSFTDKTAGNDNSKGAAYNARADQRSWDEMQRFLKELF